MAGLGLVKSLAEREQELLKRLDDARRKAEARIVEAEGSAQAVQRAAEEAAREMELKTRADIAAAVAQIEAKARSDADALKQQIAQTAAPRVAQTVNSLLKEVLP